MLNHHDVSLCLMWLPHLGKIRIACWRRARACPLRTGFARRSQQRYEINGNCVNDTETLSAVVFLTLLLRYAAATSGTASSAGFSDRAAEWWETEVRPSDPGGGDDDGVRGYGG